MGGGHGWYTPAMILFPWATVNTAWQNHLSEPLVYAGIFQFVIYGLLIDKARGTRSQNIVNAAILLSHFILVILILVLRNSEQR
jgi:hypothetical protein